MGKYFFSILNGRLKLFLQNRNYIDTPIQKGVIPGMDHTCVVSKLLKEAKGNRGSQAVLWFELKNAFGSISHKLVELTLKRYHVPTLYPI